MSIALLLEKIMKSILPDEDYTNIKYDVSKSGCWEVTDRAKNKDGYPVARIKGQLDTLYRHFYRRYKGDIPKGNVVRHTCDNRLCCNPEHLILGTQKENVGDMLERGRFPMGVKHGRAKLDDKKVRKIRKLHTTGASMSSIAREYEVDRKTIHKIINGVTWKSVE